MNRVALAIGLLLATNAFAADANYCFAFMRAGEVTISCNGQEDRITRRGNVTSYAIAQEQGVLGVVRSLPLMGAGVLSGVQMMNFKSGKPVSTRLSAGTLIDTCGGLFGVADMSKDLLTGQDVAFEPYTWFRCSADRKIIAGIVEHDRALYQGIPPNSVASPESAAHYEFNMSPNGKYLVYASDRQPLCRWSAESGSLCAKSNNALDSSHELVSVRDDGEVLVAGATADKCSYKTQTVFAAAKPNDRNTMNCPGIGHWHPGMEAPELIEPMAMMPQWISPDTAALLKEAARKDYFFGF